MAVMKTEFLGLGLRLIAGGALVLCLARWGLASEQFPAEALEFFEKKVRPVLATHCYECHGPQLQQGGLRLDSREGVLKGGTRGAAAVEGEPDSSWLIRAVRHQELEMPPAGRLSPEQIGALERWIAMGVSLDRACTPSRANPRGWMSSMPQCCGSTGPINP